MAFTLRQLHCFIAAAEQGSISHAARDLLISQSASTKAVTELGADPGVRLSDRHSRGLTITHNGHQFLRHATSILADVFSARRAFRTEHEKAARPLRSICRSRPIEISLAGGISAGSTDGFAVVFAHNELTGDFRVSSL